jgi:hypothetical protein
LVPKQSPGPPGQSTKPLLPLPELALALLRMLLGMLLEMLLGMLLEMLLRMIL